MKRLLINLILLCAASAISSAQAIHDYPADAFWADSNEQNTASIDHSGWQSVLDEYLTSDHASKVNLVDYAGLKANTADPLAAYLAAMAAIDVRNYPRAEQFAYWVNIYNALTVDLIAKNYPVSSIRKVHGGWFGTGPWDEKLFTAQGKELSLNDIEHRILRPIWQDYRVHFVVNCASIGCPNLQPQALTSANLQTTLKQAAEEFLQHPRGFQVNGNRLELSKIFKWYQSDFGDNEAAVIQTLKLHLSDAQKQAMGDGDLRTSYQYNWDLNDIKR